jgi:hypothetical protein
MESGVVDGMELLEWLQTGVGDERDLQMMALEQLCMVISQLKITIKKLPNMSS